MPIRRSWSRTRNRATGNRLRRQMLDSVTGEAVESEEQVKGCAVGKDQYVMVEDEELSNIAIESTRTIDIQHTLQEGRGHSR